MTDQNLDHFGDFDQNLKMHMKFFPKVLNSTHFDENKGIKILKGNGVLEGHVMKIGHFDLKKFLDPNLVYKIYVIRILARVKTLQKID